MTQQSESSTELTSPRDVFVPDLLAGQVAFVTGGGTGIGKEIARVLGRHGARIAIASRRKEVLEEAATELGAEGIDVWIDTFDVRKADEVERVTQGIIDQFGRLDILINNAAGNFPAPMTKISYNGFKSVVDIDLLGTYNCSKCVFEKWMRRQRRQHRQHRGGVRTEGHRVPGARRRGEEWRGLADSYVSRSNGALWRPRQRGHPGQHRQHRRRAPFRRSGARRRQPTDQSDAA